VLDFNENFKINRPLKTEMERNVSLLSIFAYIKAPEKSSFISPRLNGPKTKSIRINLFALCLYVCAPEFYSNIRANSFKFN